MIYGYARVSTPHQKLERQITNILSLYPKAQIFREHFTGTTQSRPVWEKLINLVHQLPKNKKVSGEIRRVPVTG
ncbi:MAG: recombinase family protein [Spirochaetaceae bacterium]|nr:recombinase family protein [Spirochaetaceae bacterium]